MSKRIEFPGWPAGMAARVARFRRALLAYDPYLYALLSPARITLREQQLCIHYPATHGFHYRQALGVMRQCRELLETHFGQVDVCVTQAASEPLTESPFKKSGLRPTQAL